MTDIQSTETCDPQGQLGVLFQQGRELRNLTVTDVSVELKVLSSAVKALESGDYSPIKGSVFVKGYIKAYAKFLQLDIEECLALYTQAAASSDEPAATTLMANASRNANAPKIVFTVIIVGLLITLVYILVSANESEPAPVQPPAKLASQENTVEALVSEVPATNASDASNLAAPAELAFSDIPVTVAVLLPSESELESVAVAESEPVEAHTLLLVFNADCWVQVSDANGTKLLSDLKREGERITLNGEPPYEVLLGYGPAVTLSYQGEPVAFDVGDNPTVKLFIGDKQ